MKDRQTGAVLARTAIGLLAGLSAVAIAGCGGGSGGGSKPEGQVVATIGDEEVTLRELNLELQGVAPSNNPQVAKAAEQAALNAIISRKMLAKAARDQKLDASAQFQLVQRRAEELLLAQALHRDIASKVARPTREEAERYIAQHPHSFAQRKVFLVDQIEFPRNVSPAILKALVPQKTIEEVEQLLLKNGVEHRRLPGSIDARGAHPNFVNQIVKLPPNTLFIIPNRNMFVANQIRETQVKPFTGEPAIQMAQQILMKQRIDEELQRRGEQIKKAAGEVKYKEGYAPPKAPARNAPATPANNSTMNATAPTPS